MIFRHTPVLGAPLVALEEHADSRGFFARVFCERECAEQGLTSRFVQANLSHNTRKGTLRGLHMQTPPHEEAKLVRCVRGAIFDVVVDLRADSPTYLKWYGAELTAENRLALYIPEGCAHGFQTLTDDTDILYFVSEFYVPGAEQGYLYDDPAFGIEWPLPVSVISTKDAGWTPYSSTQVQSE